jgi:hypothetical protein
MTQTPPNDNNLAEPLPGMRGRLTRAQVKRLLRAVSRDVIEKKQGMSYLPQHEARAELIRIFGPGGADHKMTQPDQLYEYSVVKGDEGYPKTGDKPRYWITAYMVGCHLKVYDYWGRLVYECLEWHVEENVPLPNRGEANAMAVTSAQSYALRRALISLGDAFGLHLYNKGSEKPLVGRTYLLEDKDSPLYEEPKPPAGQPADRERLQGAINHNEGQA